MGEAIRRLVINIRKSLTGEQDLYDAELIVKRLARDGGNVKDEMAEAGALLRRYRRRMVRRFTVIFAVVLAAILIGCIVLFSHMLGRQSAAGARETMPVETVPPSGEGETVPETEEPTVAAVPHTVTLSFTGDCTLGTDEHFDQSRSFNAYYEKNGGSYFLENVRSIFSRDDLTIVNMEGTFTTATARADKTYAFKGDPSYVDVLTSSSVEAANLANNHSHDYGSDSYDDTVNTLENAGITSFGYDVVKIVESGGVKVGLAGIYELSKGMDAQEDVKKNIAALKSQGAELIVAVFHWGVEKDSRPDSTQVALAHLAIDEGADIVVGHHPHVLQGIETYQGKTIAYSLGNFCFGGNSNPSDKDTMILQQTFTVTGSEVNSEEPEIIPCSISSSSETNNYQPTVLTGDEAARVLKKIEERSEGLTK